METRYPSLVEDTVSEALKSVYVTQSDGTGVMLSSILRKEDTITVDSRNSSEILKRSKQTFAKQVKLVIIVAV